MILEEYINSKEKTLNEFLELKEEDALSFDFLTQGDEPDRTKLANAIYEDLFPWYDASKHAGDTINTYRIAVKKYYGNYYRFLDREKQLEILEIIERYTDHDENFLFEFEDTDNNGNTYYQLSNNYQLGNFAILPVRGGINPARAQAPYLDFFDKYLVVIDDFYVNDLKKTDKLTTAVFEQSEYFEMFDGMANFLEVNGFNDFISIGVNEDGSEEYFFTGLSNAENFEEYVKMTMKIVKSRGEQMWNILQEIRTSRNITTDNEQDDMQTKINKLSLYVKKYDEGEKIQQKYNDQIEEISDEYELEIIQEQTNMLIKKFEWIKWWFWPILFLLIIFFSNYFVQWSYMRNIILYRRISLITHLIYTIFWLTLIAKVMYNFKFSSKLKVFEAVKKNKIDNLNSHKKREVNKLVKACEEEFKDFSDKNVTELSYVNMVYDNFRNRDDVVQLLNIIHDGRADDFKEAYEVLENQKHRERLEEEAQRRREAEEETQRMIERDHQEALRLQREESELRIRAVERSAQAAENLTYETGRHNREIEKHNKEIEDRWGKR